MYPALKPGDYIVVDKLKYGPRVIKIWKFLSEKEVRFKRVKGYGAVEKGDIIVFNQPVFLMDEGYYGTVLVKRCYGIPGDTILITYDQLQGFNPRRHNKNQEEFQQSITKIENTDLFPFDTNLNWTPLNYGPLFNPGRGKTIELTKSNLLHFNYLLKLEGLDIVINGDSVILNNLYPRSYTFKNNYYFMLGDNYMYSQDSRYWGFLPEKNIIGKVEFILFSLDPNLPWFKKFRWNRFFKSNV